MSEQIQFATELTEFQQLRMRVARRILWWRRKWIPMLVWYGDEIDVLVSLKEDKLRAATIGDAMEQLHRGSFYKAEKILNECGICFDTGMGPDGRDWEWDFSLRGPISVKFRRRCERPERRI